jgi:hypothetical protein
VLRSASLKSLDFLDSLSSDLNAQVRTNQREKGQPENFRARNGPSRAVRVRKQTPGRRRRNLAYPCEHSGKRTEPAGGCPTGSKQRETGLSSGYGGGGGNRTRVRKASASRHHMLLPGLHSPRETPPDGIPPGLARLPLTPRRAGVAAEPACCVTPLPISRRPRKGRSLS